MSEQEDGFDLSVAGEIDLKTVSEDFSGVETRAASNGFEGPRQKSAHAVDGFLVVAGRFDFDKRADRLNQCILPRFEIFQPLIPHAVALRGPLACFPFHRHEAAFRPFVAIPGHKPYSIIFTRLGTNDLWDERRLERIMNESSPASEPSLKEAKVGLDIHEILKILPHRYPLLLIDRVLELKRKQRIVAIKNVTINEPFFVGHFPGLPIMPGVLIVEAIAQAGGALLLTEIEDRTDKVMVFTGIERAKFRKPVSPGDQLRLEVEVTGWRSVPGMTAAKMQGYAWVGDKRVAEAIVSCQLVDSSRGRG